MAFHVIEQVPTPPGSAIALHTHLIATPCDPGGHESFRAISITSLGGGHPPTILSGSSVTDIAALAFSCPRTDDPDAYTLLASAASDSIEIWEVERAIVAPESASPLASLALVEAPQFMLFSPNGDMLVIASGSNIAYVSMNDMDMQYFPTSHTDQINDAAFLKDGALFATVSNDRTFQICSLIETQWECVYSSSVLSPYPLLSVATRGDMMAIGSSDGLVTLWRVDENGRARDVYTLKHDESIVLSLAFVSDELVLSVNPSHAVLWNTRTLKPITTLPFGDIPMASSVTLLHDESDMLMAISSAFSSSAIVARFVIERPVVEPILVGAAAKPISFIDDSPIPSTSVLKTGLAIKEPKQPKKPVTFHRKIKSSGYGTAPAATSMFTGTRGRKPRPKGKTTSIYTTTAYTTDVPPSTPISITSLLPNAVTACTYSPGGTLACGGSDGTVHLLSKSTDRSLVGHAGSVSCVDWSSVGKHVITCASDSTVRIWDSGGASHTGELLCIDSLEGTVGKAAKKRLSSVSSAQFFYNDRFVTVSAGDSLLLYRIAMETTRDSDHLYRTPNRSGCSLAWHTSLIDGAKQILYATCLNSTSSRIVVSSWSNKSIAITDVGIGATVHTIPNAQARPVSHMSIGEESDMLLTVADMVSLWDLRSCAVVQSFPVKGTRAMISPHCSFIAVGSSTGASIHDIRSDRAVLQISHPQKPCITDVAFSSKRVMLATAGSDGTIGVWQ